MFLNFTPRCHKGSENWLFNSFTVSKPFYASAAVNSHTPSDRLPPCVWYFVLTEMPESADQT